MNTKKRILVIDDSTTNNLLCESILSPLGYEVFLSENAVQAFNILKKTIPDLILLDLMLPKMDGYDILKKLKKEERTKYAPVIVISAKDQPEDIKRAEDLGATMYLQKPIGINELIEAIQSILKK